LAKLGYGQCLVGVVHMAFGRHLELPLPNGIRVGPGAHAAMPLMFGPETAMFHADIPAPGSRGVVRVKDVPGGVEIVDVTIYPPNGKTSTTIEGRLFPGVFADRAAVKVAIAGALNNNPVKVVDV
jgi:hypothetical protein